MAGISGQDATVSRCAEGSGAVVRRKRGLPGWDEPNREEGLPGQNQLPALFTEKCENHAVRESGSLYFDVRTVRRGGERRAGARLCDVVEQVRVCSLAAW